ncbi:hypothetical protein FUAX_02310 [Fulvitalea axinellae]|uniref:Endonuclease/exonuclease/phosphatase domain-containing protein n=1 Tax=Fulvitalea axinellae TaxID=1182444 RepID=A0AAU9C716_9BACT|nr:hypothetical protein FUAX_02310 [Fulvitalea axinellae]
MRTFTFLILSVILFSHHSTQARKKPKTIKVLSYNIHYGLGMDSKTDLERIAGVIRRLDPDIVGLQEIGDSTMAAKLGALTHMKAVFGPSKESNSGYGDAVLSKLPFRYVGNESIPSASSSRYQAMCVDVDLSQIYGRGATVRFVNTHFDWLPSIGSEVARKGAVEVIEIAFFKDDAKRPAILTGDLNATPDSAPVKLLRKKGWVYENLNREIPTIPSDKPTEQIDYVMPRPAKRWRVVAVEVIPERVASDHLPVLMTLELIHNKR